MYSTKRNGQRVSIPYRYTKNLYTNGGGCQLAPKFQSPIGTQKTFLADILHTQQKQVSIPYRYTKNSSFKNKRQFFECVSIPYRYTKNLYINSIHFNFHIVSIPYRYTKNSFYVVIYSNTKPRFNPL